MSCFGCHYLFDTDIVKPVFGSFVKICRVDNESKEVDVRIGCEKKKVDEVVVEKQKNDDDLQMKLF